MTDTHIGHHVKVYEDGRFKLAFEALCGSPIEDGVPFVSKEDHRKNSRYMSQPTCMGCTFAYLQEVAEEDDEPLDIAV